MKSPKCKIFKNIILLLIFTVLNFGNIELNRIFKKETLNADEWLNDSMDCLWHIMCDMNKPLMLKKAGDVVDDRIVRHALYICVSKFPSRLCNELTLEKMRDDSFWIEFIQPELCSLSAKDKQKFEEQWQYNFIPYGEEICTNYTTKDLCNNARQSGDVYNMIQAEMVREGECYIRHHNSESGSFVPAKTVPL